MNLSELLRSLPANPRVVVSGNHAVPFHTLKLIDAALDDYRLWVLNAPTGLPDRDGVTYETPFVGVGMRRSPRLSYVPCRLSLVPSLFRTTMEPDLVVLSVDPALSTHARADRSALVVLAKCGGEVRCLDAIARRVATPDLVSLIGRVDQLWSPSVILFEGNGAFRGIADLMTRQAAFGPKVRQVQQSRDKGSRVAAQGSMRSSIASGINTRA